MKLTLPFLILALFVAGCSFRAEPPHVPTVAETICSWGSWVLGSGIACLGLGVVARLLIKFAAASIFGVVAGIALDFVPFGVFASFGATGITIGAALTYLGNHPWILALAIVLTGVAFALHHLDDIRRWLGYGPAAPSTPSTKA